MKLALTELRRRPGRFATAGLILFLIATLLMILGGLSQGLNGGNDGAIRAQPADLIVFSATADASLPQSLVSSDDRATIDDVDGVAATGSLRLTQLGVRRPDRDPRDLIDVAVFGTDFGVRDVPAGIPAGTAWADRRLEERGIDVGDTLLLGPARTPVTVNGFVDDSAYVGQATLWVALEAFGEIVASNKPDEILPPGAQQALAVQAAEGADLEDIATAVDSATSSTETLTRAAAAAAIEPIDGGTLQTIIFVTTAIAVAVVALFFALLTSERLGLYGVLKAVGARDRTLLAGVIAQAVTLTVLGLVVAIPLAIVFDNLVPPDAIPFALEPGQVATSAGLLLIASVVGAALTLRRVLRIEPASVIGTTV